MNERLHDHREHIHCPGVSRLDQSFSFTLQIHPGSPNLFEPLQALQGPPDQGFAPHAADLHMPTLEKPGKSFFPDCTGAGLQDFNAPRGMREFDGPHGCLEKSGFSGRDHVSRAGTCEITPNSLKRLSRHTYENSSGLRCLIMSSRTYAIGRLLATGLAYTLWPASRLLRCGYSWPGHAAGCCPIP